MSSVHVHYPGLLTTVQDLGRWGWQSFGVPVSGALDPVSHRLANALAGNAASAATLEVTLDGPELEFEDERVVAVCGAEFALAVDGVSTASERVFRVRRGTHLRIGQTSRGCRAYVAIAGGIAVPEVLGSRATHQPTRTGGFEGRRLKSGDRLPLGAANGVRATAWPSDRIRDLVALPNELSQVRILDAAESHRFDDRAFETLTSASYLVTTESDRMGYRLKGPALVTKSPGTLLSEATAHGAIQVPPDGIPIVLEADRQTMGGYPKIAVVIAADLGLLGQLAPGDPVSFRACGRRPAIAALVNLEQKLMAIEAIACR